MVDFVYNRLTDFSFALPAHEALRSAYLGGDVVVSPHPRAHAIHADKRNMSLLTDGQFLRASGLDQPSIDLLLAAVPKTLLVTAQNHESLWTRCSQLFFKPAAGFGSRATYRGDNLTRRVWEDIGQGDYVEQELVRPSERHVSAESPPLKIDIRCYSYAGAVCCMRRACIKAKPLTFARRAAVSPRRLRQSTKAGSRKRQAPELSSRGFPSSRMTNLPDEQAACHASITPEWDYSR